MQPELSWWDRYLQQRERDKYAREGDRSPGLLPDWQFYKDVGNTLKEGVLDPKFYQGAAKEMTAGLLGLPGDVGFAIGNAPAVIDNWREGRPLDTNVGRMSDYRLTAEGLADTFGIGFEGGGAEDAGRVLGGLANVGGLLKGGARILQKAGETVGKSRSGPGKYEQGNVGVVDITPIDELWGKDVDPSIFVGGTTGRGLSGGKTPFAENPTPADMQKLMEDGTTQFRIIKDVDGNVYVYDSSAGVHQQFIDGWEDWTGKTFEVDHDFWNSVSEREFNADEVLKIMEDPAADPNFQAMNAVSGRWKTPEPDNFTESEMAVLRDIGARQQPADPAEMITKSEFQRLEADIPPDNNIDVSGTDYTELTPSERRVFDEAMRQFDEMNPGLLNKGVGGRQRGAAQGSGIGRQRGVGGEGGEVPKAIKDVVEQVSRNVDSGLLADSDPAGYSRTPSGLLAPDPNAGSLKYPPMFEGQPISDPAMNAELGLQPGQIISTRYPTGKNFGAGDRELLLSGIDVILENPQQAESLANIFKASPYTRIPANASPEMALRMQMEFEAENMVDLYESMDPVIRERAKLWYQGANRMAGVRADQYGKRIENTAGVYAALSPSKDWYMNVELGDRMMDIMTTKQNTQWSPEMTKNARKRTKGGKNAKLAERLPNVTGKTLGELTDPKDKAAWIRMYDEAHNPKGLRYSQFSPEGKELGIAKNQDGSDAGLTWQSIDIMANAVNAFEVAGETADIMRVISPGMGMAHKVRNFYNNIVDPLNPGGFSTIDTHQVAAGLLRPLGGKNYPVLQNFGSGAPKTLRNPTTKETRPNPEYGLGPRVATPRGSAPTGAVGTYGVRQAATNLAGEHLGILGAQVQSPTWENIRTIFPSEVKNNKKLNSDVERIWREHGKGKLTRAEAFEHIMNLRPINIPDWAKYRNMILGAMFGGGALSSQQEEAATAAPPGS
jgi:hypothetical protein